MTKETIVMGRFINPFTDYGFKKIFGQEISKDLLIDFLNDLLEGERVITDLTFLNNEQLPQYDDGRGLIYDIYCSTDTGEKIIVEMQNRSQLNFKERALFYLSNAIVQQGETGAGWRFNIKAVYGVFFMNFLFNDTVKLRTDVILADRDTGEMFSDRIRPIFIALPLFDKEEDNCETDFDRWIYILKNMETLKRMPFKARNAVFEKLEDIADVASLSKEERERYQNSVNVYRTHLCVMEAAENEALEKGFKKGLEKGMQEGIERGLERGMQQGIEQGMQQGMQQGLEQGLEQGEKNKQLEVARNLKKLGVSLDIIIQSTGLSIDELNGL